MNVAKTVAIASILFSLSSGFAGAQTYYAGSQSGGCASFSRELSRGARGSDVTRLQRFLVDQNYPGGGPWMISGYFGIATQTAVRNFQTLHGLARTGALDSATRSVVSQASCGNSSGFQFYPTNQYTQNYTQNSYPNYNYPYNYPNYTYTNCTTYYNAYNCPNVSNVSAPAINYLNPSSGAIGTTVTIVGSGFTTSGNTIHFGIGIIANLTSADGRSVSFTVPSQLSGFGSQQVGLGGYNVSVTNGAGNTSNVTTFTVTGTNGSSQGAPSLSYLSPAYGSVGTQVTLVGSGFSSDNTIHFGAGGRQHVASADGTTLYFTIPSTVGPCDVVTSGNVCALYIQNVTPAAYSIYVSNGAGSSNTQTFMVQ
jgi:hypothetical protein